MDCRVHANYRGFFIYSHSSIFNKVCSSISSQHPLIPTSTSPYHLSPIHLPRASHTSIHHPSHPASSPLISHPLLIPCILHIFIHLLLFLCSISFGTAPTASLLDDLAMVCLGLISDSCTRSSRISFCSSSSICSLSSLSDICPHFPTQYTYLATTLFFASQFFSYVQGSSKSVLGQLKISLAPFLSSLLFSFPHDPLYLLQISHEICQACSKKVRSEDRWIDNR